MLSSRVPYLLRTWNECRLGLASSFSGSVSNGIGHTKATSFARGAQWSKNILKGSAFYAPEEYTDWQEEGQLHCVRWLAKESERPLHEVDLDVGADHGLVFSSKSADLDDEFGWKEGVSDVGVKMTPH